MNPVPQDLPHMQSAIQAGADAILALIETECANALAASHEHIQRREQLFHAYQQHAESVHAAEQVRLKEIYQQLQAQIDRIQQESAQLAQLRVTQASTTVASQDDLEHMRIEITRANMEILEARQREALVTRQFEELQSILRKVGIAFNTADGSIRFSGSWAIIMAEVGNREHAPTSLDEFHGLLGEFIQGLRADRDKISALEKKIVASEQGQQRMVEKYETHIASLKLEISELLRSRPSLTTSVQSGPENKHATTLPHHTLPEPPSSAKVTYSTPLTLAAWNKSGYRTPPTEPINDTAMQTSGQGDPSGVNTTHLIAHE